MQRLIGAEYAIGAISNNVRPIGRESGALFKQSQGFSDTVRYLINQIGMLHPAFRPCRRPSVFSKATKRRINSHLLVELATPRRRIRSLLLYLNHRTTQTSACRRLASQVVKMQQVLISPHFPGQWRADPSRQSYREPSQPVLSSHIQPHL